MILKFSEYIKEVSGTELVGPVGPAYGETRIQNKTLNSHSTNLIYSDLDGNFYTMDEYNDLYNDYLKKGGPHIESSFNKDSIDYMINYLQNN